MDRHVTFFYAPHSRASCTLALLEELGADYDLHMLDLKKGTQREPAYLAINPMGKVPAIRHGDAVVTEQPAVMMYLGELYPESGLSPVIGDPLRGPFLKWMVFYGSCLEPAMLDRAMKRDAGAAMSSPYGDFDSVLGAVIAQLERGPYLLGERFSVADVLWGCTLRWATAFNMVPEHPVLRDYIERVNARPALQRAAKRDEEYAAAQA